MVVDRPSATPDQQTGLCAVVLAAGLGTRLRPLTLTTPKALARVGGIPLLDLAIASVAPHTRDIAVNVHYLADQVVDHVQGRGITVSDERDLLLGSAGAIGRLHEWVAGRPVLVRNADAYLTAPLDDLVRGWDGTRPRLLARDMDEPSDFGSLQYVGACLLPAAAAMSLRAEPSSLYDLVWRPAWQRGDIEFVLTSGEFVDCGTPSDLDLANEIASAISASLAGHPAD